MVDVQLLHLLQVGHHQHLGLGEVVESLDQPPDLRLHFLPLGLA